MNLWKLMGQTKKNWNKNGNEEEEEENKTTKK